MFVNMSLPAGERGLKFLVMRLFFYRLEVAPRRGAWIEMSLSRLILGKLYMSLPAGERGLKFFSIADYILHL